MGLCGHIFYFDKGVLTLTWRGFRITVNAESYSLIYHGMVERYYFLFFSLYLFQSSSSGTSDRGAAVL